MIGRHIRSIAAGMAWAFICAACLNAQEANPTEYQVKAAYLYNFGKFIEWPSATSAGDLFSVCVLGEDPFGATLDRTVAGENINGKKAVVRRFAKLQDAARCHILFISSTEDSQLGAILAALDGTSVLTVSDIPQFTQRGGMIQFVMEANKVRFEVNLTTVERDGLTMSSQLLKVAVNVRRTRQPGA